MTKALINSLNIIPDTNNVSINKLPKTEGVDFGKIFETKTDKLKSYSEQETGTNNITADNYHIDNSGSEKTETESKNTETVLQASVQINKNSDEEENSTSDQDYTVIYMTEDTEDVEYSVSNEELNIIEELITTEETTITDEEPTMYKELIPLENPTMLLLQTQIQSTPKNNAECLEQTDINDDLTSSLSNQILSNEDAFEQFENSTKELNTIRYAAFKETSHQKAETSKTSDIIDEHIVKELEVEVVSSEAENTEDSMSEFLRQSPQEQAARVMIQGDVKYESISTETIKNTAQVKAEVITPSKIIEQISKQLEGMYNNSKLSLVLNPGSLGKVNLQLVNSKDGLMAQFTVTTQDAKDLLMKGLDGLKESLLTQGVNVDNVSVKLEETEGDYKFDYTEQEDSKGGNRQQNTKKQKDNEKQFEQMMFELEKELNV